MRVFNPVNLDFDSSKLRELVISNLYAISASIKSVITQVRANKDGVAANVSGINNAAINAWTTASRPTNTPNKITIGVNTTTGNLNYTTDGGVTWKNYDGTAA